VIHRKKDRGYTATPCDGKPDATDRRLSTTLAVIYQGERKYSSSPGDSRRIAEGTATLMFACATARARNWICAGENLSSSQSENCAGKRNQPLDVLAGLRKQASFGSSMHQEFARAVSACPIVYSRHTTVEFQSTRTELYPLHTALGGKESVISDAYPGQTALGYCPVRTLWATYVPRGVPCLGATNKCEGR